MSATISRPVAGQHKSAAPFGAVALLAGVVALGAIGIALSQGVKTAVPAGPDIQAVKDQDQSAQLARPTVVDYPDQIAARLGTASTVTDYPDQVAARLGNTSGSLGEAVAGASRASAEAMFAARYNSNPSYAATQPLSPVGGSLAEAVAGASRASAEAMFAARYNSNPSIAGVSLAEKEALFAARYNSNPSIAGGTVSNLNPGEIVLRNLGQDGGLTGLSAGPQTGHQKGLDAPKVAHAGPAKHPVAN